jgi:hypothetical protein
MAMLQSTSSRCWLLILCLALPVASYSAPPTVQANPGDTASSPAPPTWLEPDGGWLLEYEVKFKGAYTGTAADPVDHPLRQLIDTAREWAAAQGFSVDWYTGHPGYVKANSSVDSAKDPAALGISMIRFSRDFSALRTPGSNVISLSNQDPKEAAYDAHISLVLPEGSAAQRDELHARLVAMPGVALSGGWPLANYSRVRYPQFIEPQSIAINGQHYNWPGDFTPAEQDALGSEFGMLGGRRNGLPWEADIYKSGHPLSSFQRLGLGPLLRFRYAGGGLSVDSVPMLADLRQLQTISWNPTVSFIVEAEEANLPFNPGELLIDASRTQYESEIRPYREWDLNYANCYRATVALGTANALAAEPNLDAIVASWKAQYPELQPGGALADAVKSGVVAGGNHPQWQVTLAVRSDKLARSLLKQLQDQGVELETFVLVVPNANDLPQTLVKRQSTVNYYGSEEDRTWAWELRYQLVPKDPHGFDAELMVEQIGKDAAAQTLKVRDEMQAKYGKWMQQFGITEWEADSQKALRYHFSAHDENGQIVNSVTVQAHSEAEAQELKKVLAGPGVPEPEIKERQHYMNGEYPRGMYLSWKLFPAEKLHGIRPAEAKAKLDRKVAAKAEADAAALKQALADWIAGPHPATGADGTSQEPRIDFQNFGDIPRIVSVITPYPEGADLDAFESRLRQAAPGLPPAKWVKPYNYAFEPAKQPTMAEGSWSRELLSFQILEWSNAPTIDGEELAAFLGAAEIQRLEKRMADISAVVEEWNATQLPPDRVTVQKPKHQEDVPVPYQLELVGDNNKTETVKSLITALDAAGLTDYRYGFGFTQRNRVNMRAMQPGAKQVPLARLFYKLVPDIYTMHGSYENLDLRLARYYTPQQLTDLKQAVESAKAAVTTWASQNGLTVVAQYQGFDVADSVRLWAGGHGNADTPTYFQAGIAVEDADRRIALERSLEQYLADHVPGLPKRDTSGRYIMP